MTHQILSYENRSMIRSEVRESPKANFQYYFRIEYLTNYQPQQ